MKKTSLFLIIIAIVIVTFTGCGRNVTGEIRNALTSELVMEEVVLYFDNEPMTVNGGEFILAKIKEGPHTLRVEHTGFIKYEKTVTLKADSKIVIALISNSAPTHTSWPIKDNQYVIGIKVHNDLIYVSSSNKILRYALNGTYIDDFATGLSSRCCFITFDGAGNLWSVNQEGKILRFDSSGAVARTYTGILGATDNWGLALDQTYIYLSDMVAHKVKKYTQADGSFVAEIGEADGIAFNLVTQMAFGPDGNLYVADLMNDRIVVLSKALNVVHTFSTTADDETQSRPLAMAFGPDDCLYVHDRVNECIKKIGPDNSIIHEIPMPGVMFINGLAFDDSGTLYVTDNSANRLIHVFSWSAK